MSLPPPSDSRVGSASSRSGPRRRLLVIAVAVMVALTAGVVAGWVIEKRRHPLVPTVNMSAQQWPPPPSNIPDAAFLWNDDLEIDKPQGFYGPSEPKYVVVTCNGEPVREQRATRNRVALAGSPFDAIQETLTLFPGDGATQYLADVRAAIGKCDNVRDPDEAVRGVLLESTPRSVVFNATYELRGYTGTGPVQKKTVYFAVVLIAPDTVLVLGDLGWEVTSASKHIFERVTPRAVKRAESWRKNP